MRTDMGSDIIPFIKTTSLDYFKEKGWKKTVCFVQIEPNSNRKIYILQVQCTSKNFGRIFV